MKSPHDTPHPDPVVTREPDELDDLMEIEPADSRQEPHHSAAKQEGVIDEQ
ncbi:hypothetical protein D3C76_759550 [compost metagenome]|uniref:Uncharacterized protein n=1 Tax=Pseudomonas jinjuensis TaxID=198616 RepID=A0A1H0CW68_9PSED|nr:hypothetical protein [Pseudomonas jinjuensis]SDN62183.1 hypothetical protein SAMN05216193_10447 [Pseudomonas jinjuensis]